MTEQYSFAGFENMAAPIMLFAIVPAIRYVALESEMMGYIKNPSARLEPLLEMMRMRARLLLKAMAGLFASLLVFLFCRVLVELTQAGHASFGAALHLIIAITTAYAAIQMLLEIRLTLIGFTYQGATKSENG
jgi:hypothetical protein